MITKLPTFSPVELALEFYVEITSEITVELFDAEEIFIVSIIKNKLFSSGLQKLTFCSNRLKYGIYTAKIFLKNSFGESMISFPVKTEKLHFG